MEGIALLRSLPFVASNRCFTWMHVCLQIAGTGPENMTDELFWAQFTEVLLILSLYLKTWVLAGHMFGESWTTNNHHTKPLSAYHHVSHRQYQRHHYFGLSSMPQIFSPNEAVAEYSAWGTCSVRTNTFSFLVSSPHSWVDDPLPILWSYPCSLKMARYCVTIGYAHGWWVLHLFELVASIMQDTQPNRVLQL